MLHVFIKCGGYGTNYNKRATQEFCLDVRRLFVVRHEWLLMSIVPVLVATAHVTL